ncbi:hypothetical protein Ga0061060_10956 [Anoxybacillus suryakundensis]|uniref:Uncharacterized protein n=2 Tax=Anoxybacillus suryakundensis TaxID=1325335 RepID=A0A0K6GP05_9BACL|nr:hypothetical protein Ga0061060_10956 [Anoxybacillus suryakundensis]
MFIEFSFDMFTYVSLLSVFVVAMTCYVTRQANHVIFVERFVAYGEDGCAKLNDAYRHMPFHTRFIMFQQRKIPINERSHASDEEGRTLLVCL